MNRFVEFLFPVFFALLILIKQYEINGLVIQVKKNRWDIILSCLALMLLILRYAKTWVHYGVGVLGIMGFISLSVAEGITATGFLSIYRHKRKIYWHEIEKVVITISNKVKVKVSGGFMKQSFIFNHKDLDLIMELLQKDLPVDSILIFEEKTS